MKNEQSARAVHRGAALTVPADTVGVGQRGPELHVPNRLFRDPDRWDCSTRDYSSSKTCRKPGLGSTGESRRQYVEPRLTN